MYKVLKGIILLALFTISLNARNEDVSLQLQWLHQFQFAGFYIAKERGFYEEVGLNVTIKEFNSSINVIDEVVNQNSEYGVSRSSLMIDWANGYPVVALGAIYQHSPSVLITTNPQIKQLQDLKKKKVMVTDGEASAASIMSMMFSKGLTSESIRVQKHSFNIEDLVKRKTDAMACYISNEPYSLEKKDVSFKVYNPRDYGFDFYGDILFTSEAELKNHPKRAEAFYKASVKGWLWAFEHIQETAKIIFEKYNTQNKPLDSYLYEGKILKKLAFDKYNNIGFIDKDQIDKIADIYRLSGFLDKDYDFTGFIDPLGFNKKSLKLGILAKRGDESTLKRWHPLIDYLNKTLQHYHFDIYPVHFNDLEELVKAKEIDFLITNTMFYVRLENKYGISRIATLKNQGVDKNDFSSYFGSAIFTTKDSKIENLEMMKWKKVAAVDKNSFGGWVMAYRLLTQHGLEKDDIDLEFYNTHDKVVQAVLDAEAEVGIVRSDTLEIMASEGKVDLSKIKILNPQEYKDFPFMVSTKLYPEWPFAKLRHMSEETATEVMVALVSMPKNSKEAIAANIAGWTVPLDYSSVHTLLKELKLDPYDKVNFNIYDVFEEYAIWVYTIVFLFALGFLQNIQTRLVNIQLDKKVKERTSALSIANKKLKELAHKDSLTGVYSRGYFLSLAEQLFNLAKRNHSQLQILSLDIDHFKNVNDTYGHHVGDIILKLFCNHVKGVLRKSDIFGRIGGEEFMICLQNTTSKGAQVFAEKILQEIRAISYKHETGDIIQFTVSIGISEYNEDESLELLIRKSDEALYKAKNSGRDRVVVS